MHRLLQTAIHYNYNSDRDAARSKQGTVISYVRIKKSKKGEASLETKKQEPSYGRTNSFCLVTMPFIIDGFVTNLYLCVVVYADEMMSQLFNHVLPNPTSYQEMFASIPVPGTLTSDYVKPDKTQLSCDGAW